ncbi:hypothetical protein PT974_06836 [Cladobotryum mycophilum]|uniref:DUF676 domain-containing protein n=1 Tax=Cladobotryum mycophilum TaxID=491253 RepID=A0ABR0SNP2_9HYPO
MAKPAPQFDQETFNEPPPPPYSLTQEDIPHIVAPPPPRPHNHPHEPSFLRSKDPRSSPSQSIIAPHSESDPRRTLLLIYIHGFYGNDQSFGSFPAHVHNYLTASLSDSHVIHSKVYPRYKTYKVIDVARDNFSAWLEPHESPTTDVILVGHSMGGLLSAEVALKPNYIPQSQYPFKHRILGTLSLDSPFLGLHPGIVVSGISSLFQPEQVPPSQADASASLTPESPSISSPIQSPPVAGPSSRPDDPNFDPPFFNDTPFKEQPFFQRMVNFASKHSNEGLLNALGNHITHHLEFGGCLADYYGLLSRYNRIRELENVDEFNASSTNTQARIRFVNYYTLSPGRPKPVQSPPEGSRAQSQTDVSTVPSTQPDGTSQRDEQSTQGIRSPSPSSSRLELHDGQPLQPEITITSNGSHEHQSEQHDSPPAGISMADNTDETLDPEPEAPFSRLSLLEMDPIPINETQDTQTTTEQTAPSSQDTPQENTPQDSIGDELQQSPSLEGLDLPPISEPPPRPSTPDFTQYTNKDTRKQAEKEFSRVQKTYAQTLKQHTKTLKERQKLIEKHRKKLQKESDRLQKQAEKLERDAEKEKQKLEKQEKKRLERDAAQAAQAEKPKKLRKFCNLPGKVNGVLDPTWVDVYMEGVDEVGAHCGLFSLARITTNLWAMLEVEL